MFKRIRDALDRARFDRGPADQWFWPATIYTSAAGGYATIMFTDPKVVDKFLFGLQALVLGAAAAALWATYRYARLDAIMTDTWWMSSWARKTVVGGFVVNAAGSLVIGLAGGRYWFAATNAVLNLAVAWHWWHQWGDGGRGWGEDDVPIIPDPDPEDHTVDRPVDPVLVELPKRPLKVAADSDATFKGAA